MPQPKPSLKVFEAAYTDVVTDEMPEWNQNSELLDWLAGLWPHLDYAQCSPVDPGDDSI